jgi:hypothetical protein
MGMDFVSIGDVNDYNRTDKKYNGERYIQLFWRDRLLTGATFLDSFTESGAVKNTLIKGLRQKGPLLSGRLPLIQNQLIKNILSEVGRA